MAPKRKSRNHFAGVDRIHREWRGEAYQHCDVYVIIRGPMLGTLGKQIILYDKKT